MPSDTQARSPLTEPPPMTWLQLRLDTQPDLVKPWKT